MRVELEALHRELGATMIYVTHDQVEAMTMADRIVVLNEGAIEQSGEPLELYRTPQSEFVADFLGSPSMNFFDVASKDGQLILGDVCVTSVGQRAGVARIGIRPEHIELVAPETGTLDVVITVKETLGGEAYLYTQHSQTGTSLVIKTSGEEHHFNHDRRAIDVRQQAA